MKTTFFIILSVLFSINLQAQKSLTLCSTSIKSITIDGAVSLIDGRVDFTKACLKIIGTTSLCDKEGKVLVSNMTISLSSSGCKGSEAKVENGNPYKYSLDGNFDIPDEQYNKYFEQSAKEQSLDGILNLNDLSVAYPNPSKGLYFINNSENNITDLIIKSANNQIVSSKNISRKSNKIEINISTLPDGIYIISYKDKKSGIQYTQKVIKQ